MSKPYKLKEEIVQFIIERKKADPTLSCRKFVSLVRENHQVTLSKSLINNIIKQNGISSRVGRRGSEIQTSDRTIEPPLIQSKEALIKNCGYFFLKIADSKLKLIDLLAQTFGGFLRGFSQKELTELIEAGLFMPFFEENKDLWLFMGKEVPPGVISEYSRQLACIPEPEFSKIWDKNFPNINNNSELYKQALLKLSTFAQVNFFPQTYRFLDFFTMQERFYSLWGRIQESQSLLKIEYFYPKNFPWKNDLIWQEALNFAAKSVNQARVCARSGQRIRISPAAADLPAGAL